MCDNGTNYFRCKECMWESHESANPELKPDECPECGCSEFEELDLDDEEN